MVKKTYKSPAMLTVQLGTTHIIAESLTIGTQTITNSGDILVKEDNTVSDVNLWDNEW